ncbi:MAG TPA: PfkB family carbohydrate kinase [Candidatus Limnocylindrales bacterium]|nr:PfkB family carbohydrate kinase [Candidatus Limnocylindrales bacterium]
MSVDVVCAGPPFLDLVFRGLPRLPTPGEEVLADEVVITPGAMANVAFALRQLGCEAVVCSPIGTDPAGRLLQDLMAEAGIPWLGEPSPSTPLSVGLPMDGDRAFVTHFPEPSVDVAAVAAADARAIVVNLPLPAGLPSGPRLVGVVGDPQIAVLRERPVESWAPLHAVILNEREAIGLTERPNAVDAARALAARGCPVIVTRGAAGVVAVDRSGACHEAAAITVSVRDTVGAGDLFTAAWLWADLADRPLADSLAAAVAYSAYSLAARETRQKGLSLAAFLGEADHGGVSRSWMREVRG